MMLKEISVVFVCLSRAFCRNWTKTMTL